MARAPPKNVKKAVKKAPVKKPVKKVVKKAPVKKAAPKRTGKQTYAVANRENTGRGTQAVTGLVGDLVTTLLTPQQLAFVGVWIFIALKFLVFY